MNLPYCAQISYRTFRGHNDDIAVLVAYAHKYRAKSNLNVCYRVYGVRLSLAMPTWHDGALAGALACHPSLVEPAMMDSHQ